MSKGMLVDSNNKEIPICNVHYKDLYLYVQHVQDQKLFKTKTKETDFNYNLMIYVGLASSLFFVIFTLNFPVSGWSFGNIITFILFTTTAFFTMNLFKKWIISYNFINQMITDGYPCQIPKQDNNTTTVYCGNVNSK